MFILYFYLIFYSYAILLYQFILPIFLNRQLPKAGYLQIGFEIFVLCLVLILFYSITRRKRFSFILTLLFYTAFLSASVTKINMLGVPLSYKDLIVVDDLVRTWDIFKYFIPYLILFAFSIGIISYFELKHTRPDPVMNSMATLLLLTIIVFIAKVNNDSVRVVMKNNGVHFKENSDQSKRSYKSGLFMTFVQAWFFSGKPEPPTNYSEESIKAVTNAYQLTQQSNHFDSVDNVIVLMTESFTFPEQFGWNTPPDHMTGFKKMKENSGVLMQAISPVYGGQSINAEFEINTGLSMRFSPNNSIPYKEYITQNIPSLARTFNDNGFETNVVHAVKMRGFGYEKIYGFLGYDQIHSITNDGEIRKSDPSGRSVASEIFAEKIFSLTDSQEKSFIFAFPNSTHAPWDINHYEQENRIEMSFPKLTKQQNERLSAYFNALDHFDELVHAIFTKYKNSDERTLVFIVGDHQPGIRFYSSNYVYDSNLSENMNQYLKTYTTSYLAWSNYKELKIEHELISINLIPAQLIKLSGIQVSGHMKFLSILNNHFSVISHFVSTVDGYSGENYTPESNQLLETYKLIHYDLLFGDGFLYKLTGGHL